MDIDDDYLTTNLAEFNATELQVLAKLINAYSNSYITPGHITPVLNKMSRAVFLTDENYTTYMLNGDQELEEYIMCDECETEMFATEFNEHKCVLEQEVFA